MKPLGFSLTTAAAALMISASPIMAADSTELETRINEINARYDQTYDQYKAEGDRLAERAPEGAETAIGIDFDVREKRHEVILDLPTINMREKRIILDLPQVTMKDRRFSFTTIKSKMENQKVGQYPETRCTDTWISLPFGGKTKGVPKCTVTWSDIITKVPVFWEEETSFIAKIPEFTWDTTTIVMHLPDVEMAEQRYVFDLPEVVIRDVNVETKRIEADADALEARTMATAAEHKAEIAEAVEADLEERKADVAEQFDVAITELSKSIEDLRSKGVDPANANGTNVLAALEDLKVQKAEALAEIDKAKEQAIS
ncbi:MAG: hypothetical protein HRU30_12450 [Rhodobacteraceae bacterium]|nr:hypothetical protein [Paracoccaceae bacterium]